MMSPPGTPCRSGATPDSLIAAGSRSFSARRFSPAPPAVGGPPAPGWAPAGRFDARASRQFPRPLLPPGPLGGQAPPVPGVLPDDPELRGDCEAGGDGAAPGARRQPPRVGRVPLGAAGQVLDLPGVGQH